jgi:A/G-specific adenine glycosylase
MESAVPTPLPASAPAAHPQAIAQLLITWHDAHQRLLPWRASRAGTRDPYTVWVAEIMLQQTRVEVVEGYFRRWMERFPTLAALADAPLDDVLKQWEGLGYYARARALHATAQRLMAEHDGRFPPARDALLALPGIGPYTVGAILSIAFGQAEPLLDGNVKRVLTRLADVAEPIEVTATLNRLWALARTLVEAAPAGDGGVLNEALIELGATVCTPTRPRCLLCPVEQHCLARRRGTEAARPVRAPRKRTPHVDVVAGVIWQGERWRSPLLLTQRPASGLLGGLWEYPGGKVEPGDADQPAALRREIEEELGIAIEVGPAVIRVAHAFTHFRMTLHAWHARWLGAQPQLLGVADWRWVILDEVHALAMGVADRKVTAALLAEREAL